jgi:hypothetical protein
VGLAHKLYSPSFWLTQLASPALVIRDSRVHIGGASKAWIRENASFQTPVFSTGDDELYYVSYLPIRSIIHDVKLQDQIGKLNTSESLVRSLRRRGFKYALDSRHWSAPFWSEESGLLNYAINQEPEAISYSDNRTQVIDLEVLESGLMQACMRHDQDGWIRAL